MARLDAVPWKDVRIEDRFWKPRLQTLKEVTIPHLFKMLEEVGYLRNFELAINHAHEGYTGNFWFDSDLYKAIEVASYALAIWPDPQLSEKLDYIISLIEKAQMPDGYLNTYFQVVEPNNRWTNLMACHELYCAGHLIEAGVAHYLATGKRSLLDVAIRFADHIDSVFGEGKRLGYPGHPEVELALVKLYKITGERRYLELARFFIDKRGSKYFAQEHNIPLDQYDGRNLQDDKPIREQTEIVGHAVRACYLMAGAADVAREFQDEELLEAVKRIWRNATEKRMYITGGLGNSASNEGFTGDYDLPNRTAYQETCASIAFILWAHRLALLSGEAQYVDSLERTLYNAALAGISLSGDKFFYSNPLESDGSHHRQGWFGCACCPPNIARLLASLGGYIYATSPKGIWVNLYISSSADIHLGDKRVTLHLQTNYPWEGKVLITPEVEKETQFALHLRLPSWCKDFSLKVNGRRIARPTIEKGYILLDRRWKKGDQVELELGMEILKMVAHPQVKEDWRKVALQRGPLVYCFEECDQPISLDKIAIPLSAQFQPRWDGNLLGGIMVLEGEGITDPEMDWTGRLYQEAMPPKKIKVRAIPYYAWDNRQPCAMKVWLPFSLL